MYSNVMNMSMAFASYMMQHTLMGSVWVWGGGYTITITGQF